MRRVRSTLLSIAVAAFLVGCSAGTVSDVQVAPDESPAAVSNSESTAQQPGPAVTSTAVPAPVAAEPTATAVAAATAMPVATPAPVRELGTPGEPLPLGGSGFMWSESGTEWTVTLTGMVETSTGDFNSETGTCLVLFGTLVPDQINDGLVSSGFDAPSFGIIADGQFLDSGFSDCNTDQLETAGYQWILDAEVTTGTTYPFFTEFFIPTDATPEAIVAGRPTSNNAAYFSPDTTNTITPP